MNINRTYIEVLQPYFDKIIDKKNQVDANRPYSIIALEKIRSEMAIEWTYNSNSIEGNTLSLRETMMILKDGITIGGKTMKEHFEAINHEKAIDYLYKIVNKNYELRAIDLLSTHELVMRNIDDEFAGRLRNAGVRITGANFTPPNASKVSSLIDELIGFINYNVEGFNDIELAAIFHHQFVHIHPFFDGNGRTGRLVMNMLLMKKGYPPAIILKNDRKKYYDALKAADAGKYEKLCFIMAQAIERSLNIYLSISPINYAEFEPIVNIVNEPGVAYGQEYISLLARRGKIGAHKEGRNWVVDKQELAKYVSNKKSKSTKK